MYKERMKYMNIETISGKVFKALSHPIRLKIIKDLSQGPKCVCELNEDVEYSQSNLSQHLRILRDSDILVCVKEGSKIIYSIRNTEIIDAIKIIEDMVLKDIQRMMTK